MKIKNLLLLVSCCFSVGLAAQIGIGTVAIDESAQLEDLRKVY